MDDWKRIPAFGNWDYANDLPITQYFECARQAGLIRYSSSSGESDNNNNNNNNINYMHPADLYAVDNYKRFSRNHRKTTIRGSVKSHVKEQRKQQGKVFDVTQHEQPRKHHQINTTYSHNTSLKPVKINPKPVDEDLYTIPPELLYSTKRKKMPGLFSCLVPPCAS
ncbi:hypothetical protein ACFE04_025229 [Oxalis oulophora]